jgi:hypothetical protein
MTRRDAWPIRSGGVPGSDGEDLVSVASGEQGGQGGEPETICRLIPEVAGDLAAEDGVLVPEYEQFGVFGGVAVQENRRNG